jgi:hypothetical protein
MTPPGRNSKLGLAAADSWLCTDSNAYTNKPSPVCASDSLVNPGRSEKLNTYMRLMVLAVATLFVHHYHPYVEDAEIYLPANELWLATGFQKNTEDPPYQIQSKTS